MGNVTSVTFAANGFTTIMAFIFIKSFDNPKQQFMYLSIMLVVIGVITNSFFILVLRENYLSREAERLKVEDICLESVNPNELLIE